MWSHTAGIIPRMDLLLDNLRLEVEEDESVLAERIAALLGTGPEHVQDARLVRRSLDARRKWDIHWSVAAHARVLDARAAEKALSSGKAKPFAEEVPEGEDGECIRGVARGPEPLR